jgi:Asp/Glu/hydantoin racemase
MTELIKHEAMIGLTDSMKTALEIATEFQGVKTSTYGRQAILERLVREGFMEHLMKQRINANAGAK